MGLRIVFAYCYSFVGRYREAEAVLALLQNDTGYGSPSSKQAWLQESLDIAARPLVDELEAAYDSLYLTKPKSLITTYLNHSAPPIMDSPYKIVKALNVSPNHTGGLQDQFDRMARYRALAHQDRVIPIVDLTVTDSLDQP